MNKMLRNSAPSRQRIQTNVSNEQQPQNSVVQGQINQSLNFSSTIHRFGELERIPSLNRRPSNSLQSPIRFEDIMWDRTLLTDLRQHSDLLELVMNDYQPTQRYRPLSEVRALTPTRGYDGQSVGMIRCIICKSWYHPSQLLSDKCSDCVNEVFVRGDSGDDEDSGNDEDSEDNN